jgi:integrase
MLKKRNGYWHADIGLPDGGRIRASTGIKVGEDKARAWEAHEKLERDALASVKQGPASTRFTVKTAYERALKMHGKWRDSASPETIEGNYKAMALHFGADTLLSTIGQDEMEGWMAAMAGTSGSTINQRLSLVSVLFKIASQKDKTLTAPHVDRVKGTIGRHRTLSAKEEQGALAYFTESAAQPRDKRGLLRAEGQARDRAMLDLIPALLDTGFRLGEMLRVGPAEVDLEAGTITATLTKSGTDRTIPMTQRVRAIMERRLAAGGAFSCFTVDSADDCWERMRDAIGLAHDKRFVIHALRHTCCTRMVQRGENAFLIQKWMGHASITTTQSYVTLDTSDLMGLARALECAVPCAQPAGIVDAAPAALIGETTCEQPA